jgi:hypothetical protein
MKQKISIVIDAGILRHAKRRASEEQLTLSDLIQRALVKHSEKKRRPRHMSGRWRTAYFANDR